MLRPGFIGNYSGTKAVFNGLFDRGGGSKGDFEPPPEPPPSTGPEQFTEIKLPDGTVYPQDKRCPEGQKMSQVPCTGPDCDPGEMDYECADDPAFEKIVAKAEADEKRRLKKAEEQAKIMEQQQALAEQAEIRRQQIEEQRAIQRVQEAETIKRFTILGVAGIGVLTLGLIIMKIVR